MGNCVTCQANCERAGQHHVRTDCVSYLPKDYPNYLKPQTNADRIRAMTDEELARFIARQQVEAIEPALRYSTMNVPFELEQTYIDAKQEWLDWLKQEADE